jgi:ribulose-phosphate 3-epimerase
VKRLKIAASILSADFGRLAEEIAAAEEGGADWIHVDVMDGHFVPNITIGPLVAAAARRATRLPLDTHLMIEKPERYIGAFADAGVDLLTVHVEASPHLHRTVEAIHQAGMKAGVALNPATSIETIREIVPYVDLVLVMSVNPGFGGQKFIETSIEKIRSVRGLLDETGRPEAELEVDGGVAAGTIDRVVRAGATVLVAGAAVYNAERSVAANIDALRRAAAEGASRPGVAAP